MNDINLYTGSQGDLNLSVGDEGNINIILSNIDNLSSLIDTNISSPQNSDHLVYNSTSGKWENSVSSVAGDVNGPSSAVNENITVFDSTTGKIIKDSTVNISEVTANTAKTGITSQQSTDITTNNAKTGITSQQATDITTNNAKVTYDDAAAVSSNTTHRGSDGKDHSDVVTNNAKISYTDASAVSSNTTHRGLTNDPHNVTATQVGLSNVSNVSTDDTAYNATSWNTNSDSATKNAIRDKVEIMDTAIGLNTSKVTNVSTNLSEGTNTETTVNVNSSDGTNATLVSASTSRAGVLTKAKFDEIVVNNAKVSYTDSAAVGSNTTHRTSNGTDHANVGSNNSHRTGDGSDHSDVAANTSASHAQSHIIVSHSDTTATGAELNTLTGGGDTTLHDHAGISENTSARHTQNTDTALGSGAVAADHGTGTTDQIINASYGTSATPPTASTTTEGSIYIQYTA